MRKTNQTILRLLSLALTAMLLFCITGCGRKPVPRATRLSYQDFSDYDYLKTLDGATVSVVGYMTAQMPDNGSFAYMTNLPWQETPFYAPNSTRLSNAVPVYPKYKQHFTHLTVAVKIVGILEVAESKEDLFTDSFDNQSYCRITNATYVTVDADTLTGDMAVWQKMAEEDVIDDVNRMFDYVNFLCVWPSCFVNPTGNKAGYYLRPSDAAYLLTTPGATYYYGTRSGYFDDLAKKVESIDPEALAELVSCIREAKNLAIAALTELNAENFTYEETYLERFGTEGIVYTLNKGQELKTQMDALYNRFTDWLASWAKETT